MSETTHGAVNPTQGSDSPFVSTRWTLVMAAAESASPESLEAFAQLYRDYWSPLYAFVRRRGHEPAVAEEITQDFFTTLLERQRLNGLTREGGKFRSFLLTALKNHLANVWDRSRAARRGGGAPTLSLQHEDAETSYQTLACLPATADELFDRQWALSLLARARLLLEDELIRAGKSELLRTLGPSLLGGGAGGDTAGLAGRLGLSDGALRVTLHRLRKRYGELLRLEIARTVEDPAEVGAELRYLIEVVGRGA